MLLSDYKKGGKAVIGEVINMPIDEFTLRHGENGTECIFRY